MCRQIVKGRLSCGILEFVVHPQSLLQSAYTGNMRARISSGPARPYIARFSVGDRLKPGGATPRNGESDTSSDPERYGHVRMCRSSRRSEPEHEMRSLGD